MRANETMTKAIPGFIRLPAVGLQSARRLAAAVALLVALALAAAGPAPAAAAGISDFRFGVVEAYAAPAAAWEMGAGWERITFRWNEIQPSGPDEWKVAPLSDDALGLELAYGRQIVGLLSNTPDWATDWGRGAGVPQAISGRASSAPSSLAMQAVLITGQSGTSRIYPVRRS
jgi:hypothetical protein